METRSLAKLVVEDHLQAQQVPPFFAQSLSCFMAPPCWAYANGAAATMRERAMSATKTRRMGISLGYVPLSPHLTLMPASAGTTVVDSGFLRQNNCTELKHSLRAVSTIVYKHKCLSVGRKYTRRNRFLSPEAQHESTRIAEPLTASQICFQSTNRGLPAQ
jgi:hypothetical protein